MGEHNVAVIGGGLAGLVAAATLARRGLAPQVFEAAPELGGRAQTRVLDGYCFNQGPHGLYRGGALAAALTDFGLAAPGHGPRLRQGVAVWDGRPHPLPINPGTMAAAAPLSTAGTACLAETFARVGAGDYGGAGTPLSAFTEALPPPVGAVIEAFVRLSTYAHAPETIDAKAALDQLRLSFGGVIYVDGGWRTLTAQLAEAARAAGATLEVEARVVGMRREGAAWCIERDGAATARFDAVVLAVPPAAAAGLASGSASVAAAARATRPIKGMCLDLGLAAAGTGADFALGIDAPTYVSLHSAAAALAPEGAGLLHLVRYLAPDEAPSAAHFAELERLADALRPGWRGRAAHKQRLVGVAIAHDYPRWENTGRRAPVAVPDAPGLFLAGDWVGETGMLSDAAAASALAAANEAAALLAGVAAS